jgi:Kef-type K+ transport system membrane component KefB
MNQLSELGVIFLTFYIGLEFDLMKLKKIFISSAFWLVLQSIGMIAIGMIVAPLLGWSGLNELFLGSMLATSSTMIIIPLLKTKIGLIWSMPMCHWMLDIGRYPCHNVFGNIVGHKTYGAA